MPCRRMGWWSAADAADGRPSVPSSLSVAPVFHGMLLTKHAVVVVMGVPSRLRAVLLASMAVLLRMVRARAAL